PVPRIAAPTARSSRLSSPTRRNELPPQLELADSLDVDARRVRGQVRERHFLDVDDLHRPRARARGDRLLRRLVARPLQRLLSRDLLEGEHPVDLAPDLGDRSADRVGNG